MKLNLLSCNAQRPDQRAIGKCIVELSSSVSDSQAYELTQILLAGDPVELDVDDKNSGSALRALRKLDIDYEIVD